MIAAALGLVGTACGGSASKNGAKTATAGPTPLRIAYVPATTALPVYVAKVRGFFAKNNLNVTLTQTANISNVPATLGHQFDIGQGTATDLIRAGSAGIDVVQVAGETVSTAANPFVKLMVRPGSGITDVAQLKGKTVGSPSLSGVIHAAVKYWVKRNGVNPASLNAVEAPTPTLPDLLKAGRVDAVEALEPIATQLTKAGDVSLGDPFAAVGEPLATNFWVAQGSWARAHRDVVARYVASLTQAQAFIDHNTLAARSDLQAYTNLPGPVASTVPLPTYNFDIRTQDLGTWVKVLKAVGDFNAKIDITKLVLSPAGK